jgi:hypothetical protein
MLSTSRSTSLHVRVEADGQVVHDLAAQEQIDCPALHPDRSALRSRHGYGTDALRLCVTLGSLPALPPSGSVRLLPARLAHPRRSPATLGNGTKSFKPKRPKNHIGSCPRGRKNGLAGFFRAQKLTIPRFWRSSRVPNVLCGRPLFAAAAAVESGRLCTLTSWESHGGRCGWTLGGWSSIRGACELLEGY